jgi:hypothetical protein
LSQPARDELEAAAVQQTAPAAAVQSVTVTREEPEERREAGPNWMLAFICAWSGGTSLFEAWMMTRSTGLRPELLHNLGFVGYALLGLGLAIFAVEAIGWGKPRRSVLPVLFPTVLTLAGVVCLVLWNAPGRPI